MPSSYAIEGVSGVDEGDLKALSSAGSNDRSALHSVLLSGGSGGVDVNGGSAQQLFCFICIA